jgi:acetyltransferase-like isoleucine patch superfamily enzyme
MDTDFHGIMVGGVQQNPDAPIVIGDNVWVGQRVSVYKGAKIASNSIVSANAKVTGKHEEQQAILAGNPAKVVKIYDFDIQA